MGIPRFNRVPEILVAKKWGELVGLFPSEEPTRWVRCAPSSRRAVAIGCYTYQGQRLLSYFCAWSFWHERTWSTGKSVIPFDNSNVWLLFLIPGLLQLHLTSFITVSCTFFPIFSSRPISSKPLSSSAKSWLIENVSYCIWRYCLSCSSCGLDSDICAERLYPKSSHKDTVQNLSSRRWIGDSGELLRLTRISTPVLLYLILYGESTDIFPISLSLVFSFIYSISTSAALGFQEILRPVKLKNSDEATHAAAALKQQILGMRTPRYQRCLETAGEKIQLY